MEFTFYLLSLLLKTIISSEWAMSASFIELIKGVVIRVVVYNATFNNILHFSYIVVVSFKLEETGENHRPVASH